jgi:glycosyltransferase involved in cell wall biosynthesis
VAAALKLLVGPRLIVTLHDPRREGVNHRFARWMFVRCADRIVMHSRFLADEFIHSACFPPERVVVLPHPSFATMANAFSRDAARRELALPSDASLIVFFGQIRPYKGITVLTAAMDRVFAARHDVHLLVAGTTTDPELMGVLEELCARHRGRVTLIVSPTPLEGPLIDKAVSAADLVVLPFTTASQSGSAIHALSLDRPVLTTRTGELVELADVGAVAAVPPGDSVLLAEAILELVDDPQRRAELARNGGAFAGSELDPRTIARRLLEELEAA